MEEALAAARPLSDLLWLRETEAGTYNTPEQGAALEARIAQATGMIGDEAARRYYRQDLENRLHRLLAVPERPVSGKRNPRERWGQETGRARIAETLQVR